MPDLLPIEHLAIRQTLKLHYEDLILNHPEYASESRLVNEYWEKLFYPVLKGGQASQLEVGEARGSLVSLIHALSQGGSISEHVWMLKFELLMYLGDIERYCGEKALSTAFYQQAQQLAPIYGRSYNQLAVQSSETDAGYALRNFLLALTVRHPFPGAKENLRKALPMFTSKGKATLCVRALSFVLLERLSGKKLSHGNLNIDMNLSEAEAHCCWLALAFDNGLLDLPDVPLPLVFLMKHMARLLATMNPSVYTIIHGLLNSVFHFIARTKRFESLWQPILPLLAALCNSNVRLEEEHSCRLPEDAQLVGLPAFASLKTINEDHEELEPYRAARLFALAEALCKAGLMFLDQTDGQWCPRDVFERKLKQRRTGALLAKQKLTVEVAHLEKSADTLTGTPWYIPDAAYLLTHWQAIKEAISSQSKRFLITMSVLAELDFYKNNSQIARAAISCLSILASTHSPLLRLQRTDEMAPLPSPKASSPAEAHRRKFLEALMYYETDKKREYCLLSDDPELIQAMIIPAEQL